MAARAIQPPRPWRSMTTSPGLERASISATTRFIGGGGAGGGSALLELLGLLDEGLLIGDLDGQDALDVLDLLVLLVELQVLLEVHLLPHQRALRVGPQVAHLGGRREGDLAVVAGVLEDLADDDADVLVAETGHARGGLVALPHELQEAGCCRPPARAGRRPRPARGRRACPPPREPGGGRRRPARPRLAAGRWTARAARPPGH